MLMHAGRERAIMHDAIANSKHLTNNDHLLNKHTTLIYTRCVSYMDKITYFHPVLRKRLLLLLALLVRFVLVAGRQTLFFYNLLRLSEVFQNHIWPPCDTVYHNISFITTSKPPPLQWYRSLRLRAALSAARNRLCNLIRFVQNFSH
jgi:hypothetical protein